MSFQSHHLMLRISHRNQMLGNLEWRCEMVQIVLAYGWQSTHGRLSNLEYNEHTMIMGTNDAHHAHYHQLSVDFMTETFNYFYTFCKRTNTVINSATEECNAIWQMAVAIATGSHRMQFMCNVHSLLRKKSFLCHL